MAKAKGMLWALAKEQIRRHVRDPHSVVLLTRELLERGKRARIVAYEFNGRVVIQFADTPKPARGAKRVGLTRVTCSDFQHGTDIEVPEVSGRDLRWALLFEVARRWPEWASRPVRNRSQAAQRVDTLIQGGNRSLVWVKCKFSENAGGDDARSGRPQTVD